MCTASGTPSLTSCTPSGSRSRSSSRSVTSGWALARERMPRCFSTVYCLAKEAQMDPIMNVTIASPEFKANPYPFYARLRAEAPVYPVTLPSKQTAWLITRYDDVAMALKDERFSKDKLNALTPEQLAKQPWVPSMFKPLERNMLDLDASDHTRLRGLVHKAFTPRLIEQMQARIQQLADALLDAVQGQGRMDLIHDY